MVVKWVVTVRAEEFEAAENSMITKVKQVTKQTTDQAVKNSGEP